ncbi:hypothetical protein H312_03468 [Anncaliia algerae PRA339]|uniref:RCC1-like domain-containing protein n=1 Tax=Anncaliia algerae PRA339 TaxID=1288291 RepID=A0A059EVV8_9MICR|nr:hypothetical protein H312_03468 [Anncaliia algerae PRA339]
MSLYGFGSNVSSQLGPSDEVSTSKPIKLDFFDDKKIISMESGYLHTLVLTDKGLFSWGCNDDGQLGREGDDEEFLEIKIPKILVGRFMTDKNIIQKKNKMLFNKSTEIVKIQAGGSFSAILTKKGHLFLTGTFRDSHGVFGLTREKVNSKIPIPVMSRVKDIKAGKDFLLILTSRNELFAVGNNDFQQIRDHPFRKNESLFPRKIYSNVKYFGCGASHYIFITKDLKIHKRGLNNFNQISLPDKLDNLTKETKCKILGGSFTSFILLDDKLYSLGMNKDGQLGIGKKSELEELSFVTDKVSDIKCKMDFALLTKEDVLYSFGTSNFGENGFDNDLLIPTPLNFKNINHFSAGADFSIVNGDI